MKIVLLVWGSLAFMFGFMEYFVIRTATHEIVAGLAFVAATVAFGAFGTIRAIETRKTSDKP